MSLPMRTRPATGMTAALAAAIAPVLEEFFKAPKEQIAQLDNRVETLEQRMEREGLTRSQHRSMQRAVAKQVREIMEALPDDSSAQHFANIYGSLKDKYNVGSYQDIPRDKFLLAMQLVNSYDGSGRNWWTD